MCTVWTARRTMCMSPEYCDVSICANSNSNSTPLHFCVSVCCFFLRNWSFSAVSQMTQFVENMSKQLEAKGKEINAYREEHNIRIRGEEDSKTAAAESDSKSGGGGVLVANSSWSGLSLLRVECALHESCISSTNPEDSAVFWWRKQTTTKNKQKTKKRKCMCVLVSEDLMFAGKRVFWRKWFDWNFIVDTLLFTFEGLEACWHYADVLEVSEHWYFTVVSSLQWLYSKGCILY